jgi:hypothetical protein
MMHQEIPYFYDKKDLAFSEMHSKNQTEAQNREAVCMHVQFFTRTLAVRGS